MAGDQCLGRPMLPWRGELPSQICSECGLCVVGGRPVDLNE